MIAISLVLAVALSAGNADFERGANEVAADIALDRLKAETIEKGLRAGVLTEKMLADPAAFKSRADAEKLCREIYVRELQAQFDAGKEAIQARLGNTVSLRDEKLEFPTERLFPKAFAIERAIACETQAKRIAIKVKPDEAELDTSDDRAIREKLVGRIAEVAGEVVFDENLNYISQRIVDPLLIDARNEQRRQREYLMRTRTDAYAPSVLKRELEANLRKNVAERQAKCAVPIRAWGVFPKTLSTALPIAVERRVTAIVSRYASEVPLAFTEELMRAEIAKDPARHRKASESERIFLEMATLSVISAAIEKSIQTAPTAEREEFASFARNCQSSAELRQGIASRLRKELLPKWRELRAELVKMEANRLWPTLMDGSWYPASEVADRIVARSDMATVLKNWRTSEVFESLQAQASLEEADVAADKSIVCAFDLARKAIAAQNEIVEKVHPDILADAKELSRGFFSSKPNLAQVIELLTEAVENDWNEHRVEILWQRNAEPKNAEAQHAELFPSVRQHIELLARQILEEMELAEQNESKTPEESVEESETEEDDLCTIEFELGENEVVVRAKRGDSVIVERRTKPKAKDFEEAVREVGSVVGRKVLKFQ